MTVVEAPARMFGAAVVAAGADPDGPASPPASAADLDRKPGCAAVVAAEDAPDDQRGALLGSNLRQQQRLAVGLDGGERGADAAAETHDARAPERSVDGETRELEASEHDRGRAPI